MSEVATTRPRFSNEELRAVTTPREAIENLLGGHVVDLSEELGSGFTVLDTNDKGQLVGKAFLILEWRFSVGDNGEFASATIMTEDGKKLIVNDGSTGIRDQLHDLENRGIVRGVLVRKGLRVSEYYYDPANPADKSRDKVAPDWKRAVTYYLAI